MCRGKDIPESEQVSNDDLAQISISRAMMVARPSNQATDIEHRLGTFVTSHAAMPLLDPPADSTFPGVVRPVQRDVIRPAPVPI